LNAAVQIPVRSEHLTSYSYSTDDTIGFDDEQLQPKPTRKVVTAELLEVAGVIASRAGVGDGRSFDGHAPKDGVQHSLASP
jgi:hypothetical protein